MPEHVTPTCSANEEMHQATCKPHHKDDPRLRTTDSTSSGRKMWHAATNSRQLNSQSASDRSSNSVPASSHARLLNHAVRDLAPTPNPRTNSHNDKLCPIKAVQREALSRQDLDPKRSRRDHNHGNTVCCSSCAPLMHCN